MNQQKSKTKITMMTTKYYRVMRKRPGGEQKTARYKGLMKVVSRFPRVTNLGASTVHTSPYHETPESRTNSARIQVSVSTWLLCLTFDCTCFLKCKHVCLKACRRRLSFVGGLLLEHVVGHPRPSGSGTGVPWVSCLNPPVCLSVQDDPEAKSQPVVVLG